MQRPLQIVFKGMETSPALEALIRDKAEGLEQLYPRLIGCRVVVEIPHKGSESAKNAIGISVEVDVPGRGPVVAKDTQERREAKEDQSAAIVHAFGAVQRQLERITDLQHGEARAADSGEQSGMVVRVLKEQGYGFVQIDGSTELYFARNSVAGDFDELEAGMIVEVTPAVVEGPMGPQASSIKPLGRHKSSA